MTIGYFEYTEMEWISQIVQVTMMDNMPVRMQDPHGNVACK